MIKLYAIFIFPFTFYKFWEDKKGIFNTKVGIHIQTGIMGNMKHKKVSLPKDTQQANQKLKLN
jgi:hypothetical protein